jgi:hypothetical protein
MIKMHEQTAITVCPSLSGEFDLDRCSLTGITFSRNAPAMQFDDGFDNGQPKTRATVLPGWVATPEALKDVLH